MDEKLTLYVTARHLNKLREEVYRRKQKGERGVSTSRIIRDMIDERYDPKTKTAK